MKNGYYCLVVLLGLIYNSWLGLSQELVDTNNIRGNIESYSDKLSVYTYGISKFNNFELSANGNNKSIRYNPNEKLNLGLGFNYKWLGLGLSLSTDFLNSDDDLYGTTKSIDMQMDVYRKQIFCTGNLQFYEGYYWENPDEFLHNWSVADSVKKRADIRTANIGVAGIYVFNNNNFSFKAAYQNTERQTKSAGSWLMACKISIYNVTADSSLVPFEVNELYPNVKNIKGLTAINLGSAGGYTYTYLLGEYFYFNGALLLGLNLQAVSRTNLSDENIGGEIKISTNAQFRLAIGCNKPKVFYGFSATIDSYSINDAEDLDFTYNYGKIRFFYGRRFDLTQKP